MLVKGGPGRMTEWWLMLLTFMTTHTECVCACVCACEMFAFMVISCNHRLHLIQSIACMNQPWSLSVYLWSIMARVLTHKLGVIEVTFREKWFQGLSPVSRNLCGQSAIGNRFSYFSEIPPPKVLVTGHNLDYNMVTVRVEYRKNSTKRPLFRLRRF